MVHFRGGRAAIDISSYPNLEDFFEDLAEVYRLEIKALAEAGVSPDKRSFQGGEKLIGQIFLDALIWIHFSASIFSWTIRIL